MNKEKVLCDIISSYKKTAVAFSGGVDSTFLLHMCKKVLGAENVLAVTINSSMYARMEFNYAKAKSEEFGVKQIIIEANEYEIPKFVENGKDRCYYCKRTIFEAVVKAANERGFSVVIDGSNFDDLDDYRPGKRALSELGVRSPLTEATLAKTEIRTLCGEHGLDVAAKPSYACLASRIPYGTKITVDALLKIEKAEEFLMRRGFSDVRVRCYGNLARIEIPKESFGIFLNITEDVIKYFGSIGFDYTTLDLNGRVTGSMNYALDK